MTEPNDPNEPGQQEPAGDLGGHDRPPGDGLRAQRRRELLRFGTAVPMVLTLRPGSTLAASHAHDCPQDPETGESSVGCVTSMALDAHGGSDASERPTMLAGRTGSSYARFWLNRT